MRAACTAELFEELGFYYVARSTGKFDHCCRLANIRDWDEEAPVLSMSSPRRARTPRPRDGRQAACRLEIRCGDRGAGPMPGAADLYQVYGESLIQEARDDDRHRRITGAMRRARP